MRKMAAPTKEQVPRGAMGVMVGWTSRMARVVPTTVDLGRAQATPAMAMNTNDGRVLTYAILVDGISDAYVSKRIVVYCKIK